jgi:hypothetical protein
LPFFIGVVLVTDVLRKVELASVEEAWAGSPKYGEVRWPGVLIESFGGVRGRPVDGSKFSLSRGLRNMVDDGLFTPSV